MARWNSRLVNQRAKNALAAMSMLCTVAVADTDNRVWVVDEITGAVAISDSSVADSLTSPKEGQFLKSPVVINTGDNGRLVLSRMGDVISVDANSTLTINEALQTGNKDRLVNIDQSAGVAAYRLKSKLSRDVIVATPHLRTYVKGTTFRIDVDQQVDKVHLIEGAVNVESSATGLIAALEPGQTALGNADLDFLVDGQSLMPTIVKRRSVGSGSLSAATN